MTREEFEQRFLKGMNPRQVEAVTAPLCPVLILAVPGSGKTTVLIRRVGYLVHVLGVKPENILTITFTRAAANEMRQRYARLFGADDPASLPFGTINAFCLHIVRQRYGDSLKTLGKNEEAQLRNVLRSSWQSCSSEEGFPDDNIIEQLRLDISYIKNMGITDPEEMDRHDPDMPRLSAIYNDYLEALRNMRRMDFDDQLVYAKQILEQEPEILEACRRQYPCVCVDEAQDTSKIQHEIIRLLAAPANRLFMVGDEDQSIYGFRAAYPRALLEFDRLYPDAEIHKLEINYRSTPAIAESANRLIAASPARRPKEMQAASRSDTPLRMITVRDREAQGLFLTELMKRSSRGSAILFRNNDSAIPLIDLFSRAGIPFTARLTGSRFFDNTVVTDVVAILRFAHEPGNTELFRRIYYRIGIHISKETAARVCSRSLQKGTPVMELLLSEPGLSDAMKNRLQTRYAMLKQITSATEAEAIGIITDDLQYAAFARQRRFDSEKLEVLWSIARHVPTPGAFLNRLKELSQLVQNGSSGSGPVLSTIHSSKGLEYDRVFLYDMLNGVCPRLSFRDCESPEDREEYEEERRLFYVAMTRARKELFFFSCAAASDFVDVLSEGLTPPPANPVTKAMGRALLGKKWKRADDALVELIGHCGAVFLTEAKGTFALMTADEIMAAADSVWRDRFAVAAAAIRRAAEGIGIQPGTAIRLVYEREDGIVQARSGKYADILFTKGEQAGQVRKYNLEFLLENNRILVLGDPD